MKYINIAGKRFGKLTAVKRAESRNGKTRWTCQCDCGNVTIVDYWNLKSGNTTSCGCVHRESIRTHGEANSRLHGVWKNMKARCYYEGAEGYKNYGGRGISVCDEWRNSFEAFRNWAYSNGYDDSKPMKECTLDRIDANGNYCPENCRWVDFHTQALNKRKRKTRNVLCVETGKIYRSAKDAEIDVGVNQNEINKVITAYRNRKVAGGYHWVAVEGEKRI